MSSDSSGDLPDWLTQHKQASQQPVVISDSDDDNIPLVIKGASKPANAAPAAATQPSPSAADAAEAEAAGAAATGAAAPAPQPARGRPGAYGAEDGDGDDAANGGAPSASQQQQQGQQPGAGDGSQHQQGRSAAAAAAAAAVAGSIAAQLGSKSEVTIMLPDKINKCKVLVELLPGEGKGDELAAAATDLSGDAGAVGRIIVSGKPGSEELQIDLKGVIYSACVLPMACTAMVLNIGPTEAKVETLVNDFVRLKELPHMYGEEGPEGFGGALAQLLDGDDENYQIGEGFQEDEGGGKGKKGAKGKGGDAKEGGDKAAAKRKKPAAGAAGKKGGGGGLGVKGGGVAKPKRKPGGGGAKGKGAAKKGGGGGKGRGKGK